ncbi:hypothetical protein EBME_0898 [bacterium endosymbiont of Mortierella elongata FMR23-6]|nr:hypothetical protein EBME_0898 [bacterium endosymbiont of Mortierella elongata FMR23-6]
MDMSKSLRKNEQEAMAYELQQQRSFTNISIVPLIIAH